MVSCLPKKFLCNYPLKVAAHTLGIIMFCVNGTCAVVLLLELVNMDYPILETNLSGDIGAFESKTFSLSLNTYAVTLVAFLDSVIMTVTNCCFLRGINKKSSLMMTVWLILTALWLGHAFVMIVVIIVRHMIIADEFGWAMCLIIFLIAFGVILYGYICTYAYRLELRRIKKNQVASRVDQLSQTI